jgi:hypothetical protein
MTKLEQTWRAWRALSRPDRSKFLSMLRATYAEGESGGAAAQRRRPWRQSGKTTLTAPVSVILILLVGCRRAFDDREPVLHLLADNQSLAAVAGAALLAFHDLDRQLEINQPRLQEGQRQQVLRVDIMGAVAGMGSHVELEERSAPRVARTTCDVEPTRTATL